MGFYWVLFLLVGLQSAHAYIDPGMGGYLIQSIWTALVGVFAFITAIIIHFFRNVVWRYTKIAFTTYKYITLPIILLFVGFGVYMFLPEKSEPYYFDDNLTGAHIYNKEAIQPGYVLYSGRLIDIDGNVVRNWSSRYMGILDVNGDYYAQQGYESLVWGRYTWDDEVIWEMELPIHHEILLTPYDTVIVSGREVHEYRGRLVEFDTLIEFDKDGNQLDYWSTWDNLEELQQYHRSLQLDMPSWVPLPSETRREEASIWGGYHDYYHLNSVTLLPENDLQDVHPAFSKGNWLISFRHGSMIFILDKDTKNVLWRAIYDQVPGTMEGQHTPFMLTNGSIVIFDNGRSREQSRVIILNPLTFEIEWEYNPPEFFTDSQGMVQLLPNGNFLITESEKGRIFEITHDQELIWEYYTDEIYTTENFFSEDRIGTRFDIYRASKYTDEFIDRIREMHTDNGEEE